MELTVLIPAHNPNPRRLSRMLAGLRAQSLASDRWEIVLIDNASNSQLEVQVLAINGATGIRIVCEPILGLTHARRRGIVEARGKYLVFVDDDNVLEREYLANAIRLLDAHPAVGAIGGRVLPEFELAPADWQHEFYPLLALRDFGESPRISAGLRPDGARQNQYPVDCAPIGAGMALRRDAAQAWLKDSENSGIGDRRGSELSSGGDNDLVFSVLRAGWEVAYFPELSLTHLIPGERLDPLYLARLNRGIQKSWMQVLTRHQANPWPVIPQWTVPLRKLKAWITHKAWRSPAAHIRWQGACGHFEGRSATARN